jgi:hypothetical protein
VASKGTGQVKADELDSPYSIYACMGGGRTSGRKSHGWMCHRKIDSELHAKKITNKIRCGTVRVMIGQLVRVRATTRLLGTIICIVLVHYDVL